MAVWKSRRNAILTKLNEKLIPIGHLHELPIFEKIDEPTLGETDLRQQSELFFRCVKDLLLGEYNQHFYPYWDEIKGRRIRFKITAGSPKEIKSHLNNLTHFLRDVVLSREYVSELLAKKTNLGLVARNVAEILQDFLQTEFPTLINKVFDEARELKNIDNSTTFLAADFSVLQKTLYHIIKEEMVGGQIITYLDRPETHHLSRSFIPSLFANCIKAGMQHYNAFLEEFLYNGDVKSDRQHEFMIWDLSKSKIYNATDFNYDKDFFDDLPFEQKFVVIPDLIPSVWKKGMVAMLFHTRKIISILVSQTRKPFYLPYKKITDLTPEKQYDAIKEASEIAGKALVEQIDSIFNIQEFYDLLYEMIFNPSSTWLANFVEDIEELSATMELDDSDADKFNFLFMNYFQQRCQKVQKNFDLVKMKLYENSLFEKVLPLDKRFVDYIPLDSEAEREEGTYINDENQPLSNKSVSLEEASTGKTSSTLMEDPRPFLATEEEQEAAKLPFVERIGIEFTKFILFKCLVPPPIQEHFNRLFRLRFSLVRANILLLQKRLQFNSVDSNKSEEVFLTFVQHFISRYTYFVFGILCDEQWKLFKSTTPTLKSINTITEAQRFLLRNINSSAGLYNNSQNFSVNLMHILQIVNNYCFGEINFTAAADQFYDTYKKMRAIVCSKRNDYLDKMSYEVFRVPPLVRLNQVERIEIDPRQGLTATPNIAVTAAMRRSSSAMSVQPRRMN
uniref:Gamma-tubulin complex component n=1 Tax=Panagrolaimus sp. ES5 TaxID=591445 RepID=A0AC34FCI5_9BILA